MNAYRERNSRIIRGDTVGSGGLVDSVENSVEDERLGRASCEPTDLQKHDGLEQRVLSCPTKNRVAGARRG
jgi:hypothetical protein